MNLDFHFLPGFFGEGTRRLLSRLERGSGAMRLLSWEAGPRGGAPPRESGPGAVMGWLAEVPERAGRQARAEARITPGRSFPLEVESFGAPAARVLVGLHALLPEDAGITLKDVEIAFLGLACAALGGEVQGVILLGSGLGPVGVGLSRGTVAEQVLSAIDLHGEDLALIVATADSAASLGDLSGFVKKTLADLWEYRRR